MNFSALKISFLRYLKEEGVISSSKELELDSIDIFTYQEEFKEFLAKEHNIDSNSLSFEYSNMLDLNVSDGKMNSISEADGNFTLDMFNELLEDEEFIGLLDGDADNKLSDEEIQHFLKFASSDDGNDKNLSFNDLLKGYDKAKSGEYDKSGLSEASAEGKTSPTTSGTQNYGGHNPTSNNSNLDKDAKDTKSLDNLSYTELEDQQKEKRANLNNKRDALSQTYSNDQQAVTEAKSAYDEAISNDNIDPALKSARDINIEAIDTQDKLISNLKTTLNDIDRNIFDTQTELDALASSKLALAEALDALEASSSATGGVVALDNNGGTGDGVPTIMSTLAQNVPSTDIQAGIAAKTKEIADELSTIEERETELTQKLTNLQNQKNTHETDLTTAQGTLTTLEAEKTTIDSQILESCNENTKAALLAYNNARETAKTNAKTAEDNIKLAQEELTMVETEINSRNSQSIKQKYAGTFFDENSTLQLEYIENMTSLPFAVIGPEKVNPDEKLPVLVFLHGSGEAYYKNTLEKVLRENFMTDLENFRGYIICPHLAGKQSSWSSDMAMESIGEIINYFAQDNKIDFDNIAMSGHSLGGMGTIYATENNRFQNLTGIKISKSVILSGYSNKDISSFPTDTRIYVGSGGDSDSAWQMRQHLVNTGAVKESNFYQLGSSHGSLDQDAFNLDQDGNNRSDIFEWLFENKNADSNYYRNL